MFLYKNQNESYRKGARVVEVVYWVATLIVFASLFNEEYSTTDKVVGGMGAVVLFLTIYMRHSLNKLETICIEYETRYKHIAESLRKLDIKNKILASTSKEEKEKYSIEIKTILETIDDKNNIGDWSFYKHA